MTFASWRVAPAILLLLALAVGTPAVAQGNDGEKSGATMVERAPAPTASPAAPAAPPVVALAPVGTGHLPRDLSPWSMFMAADWVVKGIMLGLVFASLVTWTVWFAKTWEVAAARRRLSSGLKAIANERTLGGAYALVGERRGVLAALMTAAAQELKLSADVHDKNGIKERVASRLQRIEVAAGRAVNRGTGILGTIGSTAPFVGLFGTVWGIMNSFIGISKAQTTNLAVVAPGIAEALLATAIGLFAAIPAVIIYNYFARQIAGYKALVGDASAEVQRLVSRDLDRAGAGVYQRAAE
jgi:biopolymer transport protein ExbB